MLCGGSALIALAALIAQLRLGGLVSLVAGLVMIGFELVEITVVGFPLVTNPGLPQSWLQTFYLVIGVLMAVLGWLLWRSKTA
ncbi:MAG TPA: hypothetical protein VFU63_04205 [Ktedonobacterales bacterium]|nr:hypothetical protein [Ktedonobacterales bacterium]